ncbi:hypothetical protein BY996DRAFT_2096328 [Phakopsora pachyrhizi]|uniref:Expressed protein n=1 Tax=Phakopsora pachyrhizi TaxID=170000 RepID=A0AAV0AVT0_PHAPC|nr:hypothetical protein BY996DRAFT_2096328 [Phakopsora pachyrhizi]CAH7672391.1 expressed protein [Phakopsora pachyrhizi]
MNYKGVGGGEKETFCPNSIKSSSSENFEGIRVTTLTEFEGEELDLDQSIWYRIFRTVSFLGFLWFFLTVIYNFHPNFKLSDLRESYLVVDQNNLLDGAVVGLLQLLSEASDSVPSDACSQETRNYPPHTLLGLEAERAFRIDSVCLSVYHSKLQSFLDSDPSSLEYKSLRNHLSQSWLKSPFRVQKSSRNHLPIPKVLIYSDSPLDQSWYQQNPDYDRVNLSDRRIRQEELILNLQTNQNGVEVLENLSHSKLSLSPSSSLTLKTLNSLRNDPVIEKFLYLYHNGGVYVKENQKCQRKLKFWNKFHGIEAGGSGRWSIGFKSKISERGRSRSLRDLIEPSVMIGLDDEVNDSEKVWQSRLSRPIILSTKAMAFTSHHPILLDTIRRISIYKDDEQSAMTDSLVEYIGSMTEAQFHWSRLRKIPLEGIRLGDVLVLSKITFDQYVS